MPPLDETVSAPEARGEVSEGYLVIADVSSSTAFLSGNELIHAARAIRELLRSILEANTTPLCVAKLEGDAVFLYTRGSASQPSGNPELKKH